MLKGIKDKPLGPWFYLFPYLIPLVTYWGYSQGGVFLYATPILVFVILPVLDALIGTYTYNPNAQEMTALKQNMGFKWVAWGLVPVLLSTVIWGAYAQTTLTGYEWLGMTISVGLCSGGVGINLAHELIHKPTVHERRMGQILLMNTSYMHFYIEHLLGHHRRIGTPEDPATARRGESLYAFYVRSLWGSYKSAWGLEKQRLHKQNSKVLNQNNRMLWFAFWPAAYALGLGLAFGPWAAVFFALQSFVGFSLLEAVNYVEHYGLERKKMPQGHYEKVDIVHSWNANQLLTNGFLFMLQRHSDHHAHQSRHYQTLRQFDESPQLPTGYAGMLVLALFPPLWFWVMDRQLEKYQQGVKQLPLKA